MKTLTKDIIGHKLPLYTFRIERGKIKEFCRSIGETNPIYLETAAAKAAGYSDTPIPPTFLFVIDFWAYPCLWEDLAALGVDTERLLHLKQSFQYFHTIYPETNIQGYMEITDIKLSRMDMVYIKSRFKNSDGVLCASAEMVLIIRP